MNKFNINDKVMNNEKETKVIKVLTVKDRSYYQTEDSLKENPLLYIHEDNLYPVREIEDLSKEELIDLVDSYNTYKTICNVTGAKPGSLRRYLNTNFNRNEYKIDYLLGFDEERIKLSNNVILYDDMMLKDSDNEAQISFKILMNYERYMKEYNNRKSKEAYNRAMENLARI